MVAHVGVIRVQQLTQPKICKQADNQQESEIQGGEGEGEEEGAGEGERCAWRLVAVLLSV